MRSGLVVMSLNAFERLSGRYGVLKVIFLIKVLAEERVAY
jgi:hypothetical protein